MLKNTQTVSVAGMRRIAVFTTEPTAVAKTLGQTHIILHKVKKKEYVQDLTNLQEDSNNWIFLQTAFHKE